MSSYYEKILATGEVKCIDEEVPFEIPQGWEWCRLRDISIIQEGPGIRSFQYTLKGAQLLTVTNILEGAIDLNKSKKCISNEEYVSKYLHFQLTKGDIVCACSGGSWGKSAVFNIDNKQIILNTSTLRLRFFGDLGCNTFLYNITKPSFFKLQLAEQLSGIQPNFGYAHYSKVLIPLPPLNEQERIVAKFAELSPQIDKYSKAQDSLDKLNNSIKVCLEKSILQDAIQGKLVPQIAEEGSAQELLDQIRSEKQKLVKEGKLKKSALNDTAIFRGDDNKYYEQIGKKCLDITEELPFDLPNNWTWCRLGNLISITSGENLTSKQMHNGKIPVYGGNGITGYHSKANIFEETIVIGRVGYYCGSIHLTPCQAWVTDNAFITQYSKLLNRDFLIYLLTALNLGKCCNATAQPVVSGKKIYPLLIALPPFKEQKRIVAQIEKLFEQLH